MAHTALRCLARSGTGLTRNLESLTRNVVPWSLTQVRGVRPQGTPKMEDVDISKLPDFEISKDPNEWQYVERLLRDGKNLVPQPKKFEGKSPAGWTSPKEEAKLLPYFIPRNKSFMQPAYLCHKLRGSKKETVIKRVQGDIWQCEKDLRTFLESKDTRKYCKTVASRVNEMSCQIKFKGDYLSLVKYWMDSKGF